MRPVVGIWFLFKILLLVVAVTAAPAAPVDPRDVAAAVSARVLVNASTWGVVSSLNYNMNNSPFGNALSYSDGGTGTPFFYLTALDMATANFSAADARSSLTLSEYALGTCGIRDPQEPTCVKVTLSGVLRKLDPTSKEGRLANETLYERHPRFSLLPAIGMFQLYKLEVRSVFVLNTYGEPRFPALKLYRSVQL